MRLDFDKSELCKTELANFADLCLFLVHQNSNPKIYFQDGDDNQYELVAVESNLPKKQTVFLLDKIDTPVPITQEKTEETDYNDDEEYEEETTLNIISDEEDEDDEGVSDFYDDDDDYDDKA